MTMKFLEMAMQSAQGSTNPFISALTPIASALVGARNEKIRGDARDAEVSGMTDALLGPGGMSPDAKQALDILNNENAPSYLKAIAQKKFDAAMAPIMGAGGGSGGGHKRRSRSSGGGGSTKTPRLYGAVVNDANGRPGRYDGHGQWWPLIGPDGGAAPGPAPLDVAMAPIAPPDPVLPKDPTGGLSSPGGAGMMTDDELLLKYGG
ncbi:MAG: hypothetical protein IPM06_20995 [Rhizobiales bacterium]|nr:hypothetical protein [Hyphomicrobiales bacterium]